jgi:hypothetical protein
MFIWFPNKRRGSGGGAGADGVGLVAVLGAAVVGIESVVDVFGELEVAASLLVSSRPWYSALPSI